MPSCGNSHIRNSGRDGLSEKLFPNIKVEFFFSTHRLRHAPEQDEYFQVAVRQPLYSSFKGQMDRESEKDGTFLPHPEQGLGTGHRAPGTGH